MPFDFSLINQTHFILLLLAFIGCFGWIYLVTKRSGNVIYAGLPIIGVTVILASSVVPDAKLTLGLVIAALVSIAVGTIDERLKLSPFIQFAAQLGIVIAVILCGWTIPYVTNIFGQGIVYLTPTNILTFAPLWTALWLLLMINAVNWIDGIDGLAGGIGLTSFIVLVFISLLPATQDMTTINLAVIGSGVTLGFILWNWQPAKAYLGTSGSWFLGIYIAFVAMQGGGKIATTLLVLAIPVIDACLVILARMKKGQAPWKGDTTHHLHHRLKAAGFSDRAIVVMLTAGSAALGVSAVLLRTADKIWVFLAVAMVLVLITSRLPLGTYHRKK